MKKKFNFTKDEQCSAIMEKTTEIWLKEFLSEEDSVSNYKYSDIFDVTENDVVVYMKKNGPGRCVHINEKKEGHCLFNENEDEYILYYIERGCIWDEWKFDSLESAYEFLARKFIDGRKSAQNGLCKTYHPELDLPPPNMFD